MARSDSSNHKCQQNDVCAHSELSDAQLHVRLKSQQFQYAGNKKLKIYGSLHCASGKRMRRENRVFFASLQQAADAGYRPCGHCQKDAYQAWIYSAVK